MAKSIAIIGAGPAGLTLARLLQVNAQQDIDITIFEKDASRSSRSTQGGTLDLHPDTGIAALKKAGLWDLAFKHMRYEGEEMVIADKNATELLHMKEAPKIESFDARPEIDRERLKEILLDSVKSENVKWGKNLRTIDTSAGTLHFGDGTTSKPFDLIIGADGAWSKVRTVVTDVKPHYSGIAGFQCQIADPNNDYPALSKFVGRGSYFAMSDGKSLTAQRMGDESIKIGMWFKDDESYPVDILASVGSDEAKLKERLLQEYAGWAPRFRELIQASHSYEQRPLYELPVGHTWEHKRGFTLIGDAASLMTPFAGEGVNKAMKDSLELADLLIAALNAGDDLDSAVLKYETTMFPRAKKYQAETARNKEYMFSGAGPVLFLTEMVGVMFEEIGWSLEKGFMAWMPIKFIAYHLLSTWAKLGILRRKVSQLIWGE